MRPQTQLHFLFAYNVVSKEFVEAFLGRTFVSASNLPVSSRDTGQGSHPRSWIDNEPVVISDLKARFIRY